MTSAHTQMMEETDGDGNVGKRIFEGRHHLLCFNESGFSKIKATFVRFANLQVFPLDGVEQMSLHSLQISSHETAL